MSDKITNKTSSTKQSTLVAGSSAPSRVNRINDDLKQQQQPYSNEDPEREKKKQLQLFFGGSCNPTTWRRDIATPFLEAKHISYYNPQVDNWTPDLVEVEREAKQNAAILLFVIDRQTRSTVSIVESAFMAGRDRELVMVMVPFQHFHDDDDKSDDCTPYQGEDKAPQTDQSNSDCSKSIHIDDQIQTSTNQMKTQIRVKICDEILSPRELAELGRARQLLHCLLALRKIPIFPDLPKALEFIDLRLNHNMKFSTDQILVDNIRKDINNDKNPLTNRKNCRDIYLYFDEIEEKYTDKPTLGTIIHNNGFTYEYVVIDRFMSNIRNSQNGLIDIEHQRKLTSLLHEHVSIVSKTSLMLFVISQRSRAILTMLLASHFIALYPKQVILFVEDVVLRSPIEGQILTETALADYNRGRLYLRDYATQSLVPVFNSQQEAINCCIDLMKKQDYIIDCVNPAKDNTNS